VRLQVVPRGMNGAPEFERPQRRHGFESSCDQSEMRMTMQADCLTSVALEIRTVWSTTVDYVVSRVVAVTRWGRGGNPVPVAEADASGM